MKTKILTILFMLFIVNCFAGQYFKPTDGVVSALFFNNNVTDETSNYTWEIVGDMTGLYVTDPELKYGKAINGTTSTNYIRMPASLHTYLGTRSWSIQASIKEQPYGATYSGCYLSKNANDGNPGLYGLCWATINILYGLIYYTYGGFEERVSLSNQQDYLLPTYVCHSWEFNSATGLATHYIGGVLYNSFPASNNIFANDSSNSGNRLRIGNLGNQATGIAGYFGKLIVSTNVQNGIVVFPVSRIAKTPPVRQKT